MIHYYLFIEAGNVLDTTARYYKVGIGASHQAQRDYLSLVALASDNNYFFVLWGEKTVDFLRKCMVSVFGSDDPITIANHLVPVSARDLVRTLKNKQILAPRQTAITNANHVMRYLSVNYRFTKRGVK